jgi:hypothetical protein
LGFRSLGFTRFIPTGQVTAANYERQNQDGEQTCDQRDTLSGIDGQLINIQHNLLPFHIVHTLSGIVTPWQIDTLPLPGASAKNPSRECFYSLPAGYAILFTIIVLYTYVEVLRLP